MLSCGGCGRDCEVLFRDRPAPSRHRMGSILLNVVLPNGMTATFIGTAEFEPYTPTSTRSVPGKSDLALEQLLDCEPFSQRRKAHLLKLNTPAPCPPRGFVLVNQCHGLASLFHLSTPCSLSVRDATVPAM